MATVHAVACRTCGWVSSRRSGRDAALAALEEHRRDCPTRDTDGACPTCSGSSRETVGMVCQTCGTDYAAEQAV